MQILTTADNVGYCAQLDTWYKLQIILITLLRMKKCLITWDHSLRQTPEIELLNYLKKFFYTTKHKYCILPKPNYCILPITIIVSYQTQVLYPTKPNYCILPNTSFVSTIIVPNQTQVLYPSKHKYCTQPNKSITLNQPKVLYPTKHKYCIQPNTLIS